MVDRLNTVEAKEEAALVDFVGNRLARYKPDEISVSIGYTRESAVVLSRDPKLIISAITADKNQGNTIITSLSMFLRIKGNAEISTLTKKTLDTAFQKTLRAGITSGRITP